MNPTFDYVIPKYTPVKAVKITPENMADLVDYALIGNIPQLLEGHWLVISVERVERMPDSEFRERYVVVEPKA